MGKILYTVGYGNRKPDDFLKVLKDAGITVVLDVRRKGSKSWCGAYRWGCGEGFGGMEQLLRPADILYLAVPELANTCLNLGDYAWWIGTSEGKALVGALRDEIEPYMDTGRGNPEFVFCLLCSEKDAYKDGEVNCHRVYVAEALVKQLGDGWRAVNL